MAFRMRSVLGVAAATVAFAGIQGAYADLIITEVVDATLPGGLPKFVELTNAGGAPVDLSLYSIGNYNNGNPDLGGGSSTALNAIMLAPGASYVIAYEFAPDVGMGETSVFEDTYGFAPDQFTGPFINGDDVVRLFLGIGTGDGSDATAIDTYGIVGVDGTGEPWEYTDGYSFRQPGQNLPSSGGFVPTDWFFGGANSLETGDDAEELALILSLTTPGTHNLPGPGALSLLALAGLAARRRRRA